MLQVADSSRTKTGTGLATISRKQMLGLRAALIVIAVFEEILALWNIVFGDVSTSSLGNVTAMVHLAVHPLLALAGLVFAATGRVRHAIIALGAIVILTWLNYLPSLGLLDLKNGWDLQWAMRHIVVFPPMAVYAMMLAARDRRLVLATALISIVALENMFGAIVFAIGIIINGP